MIIFRKMFADKILRYHESMNKMVLLLEKIPGIGEKIREQISEKNNTKLKTFFGILSQIGIFFFEFFMKVFYVLVFMYIPYRIMAVYNPLIEIHQENTLIFLFFILSTICGSLANTLLLALGDRDYMMIRVMLISPYVNYLGNLLYKIAMEFVYYSVILMIFGVSAGKSILISFVTAFARLIGEAVTLYLYDRVSRLYENRSVYNGFIMAISILVAYGIPLMNRKVPDGWMFVVSPAFVIIIVLVGMISGVYLYRYKYYRKIMREAMYIKREK